MAMNIPATTDADKAYAMKAAEFRSLPSGPEGMARLRQATNGPFGALALIEIDKRTRAELLNAVQKQAANQQQGTMLQQTLQREAQARMMNQLANDERMGLNNIVAQAEQGAIDFGQPMGGAAPAAAIGESQGAMPMGAGGGVVAFRDGGRTKVNQAGEEYYNDEELGRVYEDGSLGFAGPFALIPALATAGRFAAGYGPRLARGVKDLYNTRVVGTAFGRSGLPASAYGPTLPTAGALETISGLGTLGSLPFMFDYGGEETPTTKDTVLKDTDYPDETKRGTARDVAEGRKAPDRFDSLGIEAKEEQERKAREGKGAGIAALTAPKRETDVRKILEEEDKLLKEMGLGEYGAKVKESIEKRRSEVGERAEKRLGSEPFLAAAEAAGGGGKRMSGLQALAAAVGAGGKSAAGLARERDAALDKISDAQERLDLAADLYQRGRVGDAQKIGREAQQNIFDNQIKLRTLDLTQQKINATLAAAQARAGAGGFKQDIAKLNTAIQDTMRAMQQAKDPKELAMLQQQLQILRAAQARALMSGGSGISITDTED